MTKDIKSIYKNPKFMYLWVSQILSQLTVNIMNFLFLAHIFDSTHSSIAVSLLWVAYSVPALIIGPIGAASVDLMSRRKMLMITNLLQAATVFAYIFINHQSIFILYAIVFTYSALNQFYGPAESAALPSTVNSGMLARANSLFFMTLQATLILGFGIAGILAKTIGFNGTLVLSTIFLFVSFVSVSFLAEDKPKKRLPGEFEQILRTFFDSIIEGYSFIIKNKPILFPLLILLGLQSILSIIIISMPVIAVQILNISVNFAGISIAVPAGIGALLGTLYIPKLIKLGWRKKTIIDVGLCYSAIALFTLSLGVPLMPINLKLIITPILIMLTGLAFVGINIPALTFLQESTPDWFRGRVFGNLWFMSSLASMLPVLFSGAISEIFGVRILLSILAAGSLFVLIYSRNNGQSLIETHFVN